MNEEKKTTLGQRVYELRTNKGWTQVRLSEASGISIPEISEIEKGNRKPQASTLQKLASALDCDLGELIHYSLSK